ncbi:THO complex subunit 2-like [Sarcoptes scabiei]|nr:THO complex subunit 2-like [Sarcoptes scabiei]
MISFDNIPFKSFEILLHLSGSISDDENGDDGSSESLRIDFGPLPIDEDIINVIVSYRKLKRLLSNYSIVPDEFLYTVYKKLDNVLNQTYRIDLANLEHSLETQGFCNFNVLNKYSVLFADLLQILQQNNESCQTLFLLLKTLNVKYEIKLTMEHDPLFQKMFLWMTRGQLSTEQGRSFFILNNVSDQTTILDLAKIPIVIEPFNAIKIYNIGEMVRKISSCDIKLDFFDSKLYWHYHRQREQIYEISTNFDSFLNRISSTLFTYIMQNTSIKKDFLEFIKNLEAFYLHGNELFWTNFYEIVKSSATIDKRIAFIRALYATFDDQKVDLYIHLISFKDRPEKKSSDSFKIHFKQTDLMKIFVTDKILKNYQFIFRLLQKIKSRLWNLYEMWKHKQIFNSNYKQWFLLYSLIRVNRSLYTYMKV